MLSSRSTVTVNRRQYQRCLLDSGDVISVGRRGRSTFLKPVAASATAVLDLASSVLPRTDIRKVVLLADGLIFGADTQTHLNVSGLQQRHVLYPTTDGWAVGVVGAADAGMPVRIGKNRHPGRRQVETCRSSADPRNRASLGKRKDRSMTRFQYQSGDRPLDGYTIEYALGRGGFGEVYYAVSDAGRQVALKAVQNYEDIELRGIGHCMNLKSQHLVSIFDVRKGADGVPWVIMEFVAGPSLRDLLDESPQGLGPEKATFFLRELAKGLSYLHSAGVVHRDLKPHNVFFEDGVVKIGDYSLSKVITTSHRSGHTMTVGTVHYMAPEIGMGRYDKTVDLYALGVMLYEMLVGSPPYTGDSMGEVLMKHLSATPDVSMIDEPFASVISKAMHRDPEQRYQSAEEMAAALSGLGQADLSMTGFGPASLSIVADRAAQKIRKPSEESTDRVDAALAETQADSSRYADQSEHPMRQLGRDFGYLAGLVGMIGPHTRSATGLPVSDPIPLPWRLTLALATVSVVVFTGAAICDTYDLAGVNEAWDQRLGPFHPDSRFLPMPSQFVETAMRILVLTLAVIAGAMTTRWGITRGLLPDRPKRCRLIHVAVSLTLLLAALMIPISPVGEFYFPNLIAVCMPLLIQNWCLLTSPVRVQRIRLTPVLFAALIGFVIAEVFGGNSILAASVVTAGSLAIQALARLNRPGRSGSADKRSESEPIDAHLAVEQPQVESTMRVSNSSILVAGGSNVIAVWLVLLVLLILLVGGLGLVAWLVRSDNAHTRIFGWVLLVGMLLFPILVIGLFSVRTVTYSSPAVRTTAPSAEAITGSIDTSSASVEVIDSAVSDAMVAAGANPAWSPMVDQEFDADVYPTALVALGVLADRAAKSLLASDAYEQSPPGQRLVQVRCEFDSPACKQAGLGTEPSVPLGELGRRLAEKLDQTEVVIVDAGETKADASSSPYFVVRVSLPRLQVTSSRPDSVQGTAQLTVQHPGMKTVNHFADFVDKPWVESLSAFESSQPQDVKWMVARSPGFATVESGARHQALEAGAAMVRSVEGGDAIAQAIRDGTLIRDRFTQRLSRPYGEVWREAILIDVTPSRLAKFRQQQVETTIRSRTTFAARLFFLAALMAVAAVVYLLLSSLTRGYYRLPVGLAVGGLCGCRRRRNRLCSPDTQVVESPRVTSR